MLQSKILHYMRQMAVITPYAQFLFKFVSETSEYVVPISVFCISHLFPILLQRVLLHSRERLIQLEEFDCDIIFFASVVGLITLFMQ